MKDERLQTGVNISITNFTMIRIYGLKCIPSTCVRDGVCVCVSVSRSYLGGASVLLVQRVVLAALLLVLLVINLQLLSHLLDAVLLHQLWGEKKTKTQSSDTKGSVQIHR